MKRPWLALVGEGIFPIVTLSVFGLFFLLISSGAIYNSKELEENCVRYCNSHSLTFTGCDGRLCFAVDRSGREFRLNLWRGNVVRSASSTNCSQIPEQE